MSTSVGATSHEVRDTAGSYVLAEAGGEAVPAGYKRSEVGVIPEDWKLMRLGDHATFRTGPFGSALHKSDYTDGGVPVVNPMHIIDSELVPTSAMSITEGAAVGLTEFRLKAGEIVIGRRGDMGRCAVVREDQAGWLCGTGSMIVRCSKDLDPDFLQRVLSSPSVIRAIEGSSVGSTMINLNQSVLAGLKLQYPPIHEQRAIAAALSDVDVLRANLDQLIAKKRDLKQAAMQRLLTGEGRLPGFDGEWLRMSLADLGVWKGGATPLMSKAEYWAGGDIPWASSSDVRTGLLARTAKSITRVAVQQSSTTLVEPNSLLIVTRSGILRRYLPVALNEVPMAINQDIKAIIPNSLVSSEFLLHVLTYQGRNILGSCLKSGTTVESIEYRWLKKFTIDLPMARDEQTAIATILSNMDIELAALETRRDKTRSLKQGMTQALLTGRIRLT